MKLIGFFYLACLVATLAPLFSPRRENAAHTASFPGWTQVPIVLHSVPAALGPREARFAADFPGHIAVFREEERIVLVRWMASPNRRLHPAADCLRAIGYAIKPGPLYVSDGGLHWGTLAARHGQERLWVRERIVDSAGSEWTDVSSWYWSALLGKSAGPWWALTIFEADRPLEENPRG